ncbi:MAG: imidazolonepropionase [Tissierellales bacterium]|nr:imidazolonepropionase [Tissierellales bacterium]
MRNLIIHNASELVFSSGYEAKKGKDMNKLTRIEDGMIVVENGVIVAIGPTHKLESKFNFDNYEIIDARGKSVLPGFVDSHTHFVFGGYREEEFSWRLEGKSYMEIMERGGGIVNSVEGTKKASYEELLKLGEKRLDSMMRFGVTTVEGKSGYGLDYDTEIKQLEVMRELNSVHELDIVPTFLGAHAVPNEYKGNERKFIEKMIRILPEIKEKNLAEFCDVFCEKNVFEIEDSKYLLEEACKIGLKLKLHADEIVQLGGAELAANLKAVSADHLLQASDEGIDMLANTGTIATLLPATAFSLKENYARGRYMIDQGCAVALASDLNPGSCFTESIPLLIALSTLYMNLTIEETVTALTLNGAAALDRADRLGSLDLNKQADMIILEHESYKFLPYHIGVNCVETVIKNGKVIYDKGRKLC